MCLIQKLKGHEEEKVMALVKCPECGREVSDAAVKCPNCGYPLKAEQKKKEREARKNQPVECPECHNMVESHLSICPNCGYKVKNGSEIVAGKIKKSWNSEKGRKIIVAVIVLSVLLGGFIGYKGIGNEFSQYTKYIGKDYTELPKNLTFEDLDDDMWSAQTGENAIEICGEMGTMYYGYSKVDFPEYKIKANKVMVVSWYAEAMSRVKSDTIRDKLVDIYGKYDDREITDWNDEDYLDYGEKYIEYSWENKKGMDITYTVYPDPDDDKEVEKADIVWNIAQ